MLQGPEDQLHILNCRLMLVTDKCISQLTKNSLGASAVKISVRTGQIAKRSFQSRPPSLERKPSVTARMPPIERNGETEFESHVESRRRKVPANVRYRR